MSLAELMALAERARADDKPPHFTLPLAQAMELRDRFARANDGPLPSPGDLVRFKRSMGDMREPYESNVVLLFWRFLDPSDWHDQQIIAGHISRQRVNRVDCLIGVVLGGDLGHLPTEAARLEIITEDDLK